MKKPKWRVAAAVALAVVLAEGLVQLSGAIDIPVYDANNQIGYIPSPNQSGSFLHKNDFRFNEFSMGAGPFKPDPARFNLLLVGDSIVLGGNPLAEHERLGPQLEKLTGWQVWPISAGSWGLQNQLTYMRQHPDILQQVDAVLLLSNWGDFDGPSSWTNKLTHPLHRPFPGLQFMLEKYVLRQGPPPLSAELAVAKRDWRVDLHGFSTGFGKPIYMFMYPDLHAVKDKPFEDRLNAGIPDIQRNLAKNGTIFVVSDHPEWGVQHYRDDVHPNGLGNAALARIFYTDMCRTPEAKMACKPPQTTQ